VSIHAASIPELRAARDPHGTCISSATGELDNSAFLDSVQLASARLSGLGIGRGDVVAVMMPNDLESVVLMFAVWLRRATLTPINPVLTRDEVEHQLSDSGAALVIADDSSAQKASGLGVDVLTSAMFASQMTVPADGTVASVPSPGDIALLVYTSGTTAKPKGVLLSHDSMQAMATVWIDWLEVSPADRCLLFLPLFHVNGIMISVVGPLWAGASVHIEQKFVVEDFWTVVEREQPTYFSAVPTILAALIALPDDVDPDTSSMRFAGCGAAPASSSLLRAFERRYRIPVIEGYGLTECTVAATINPLTGPRKPGTVGVPLPGIEVGIVDEQGHHVEGGVGEVVVRGRTVMLGYLGHPRETATAIRDGWLHTGDVGYFDDDGYLVISDRIKDLVIWGGENISSTEVERVLAAFPGVQHASVVGRPHQRFGEEPVAFVTCLPGATVDVNELLAFCGTRLARFKVPRQVWIVDALPTNAVGKILKGELRSELRK